MASDRVWVELWDDEDCAKFIEITADHPVKRLNDSQHPPSWEMTHIESARPTDAALMVFHERKWRMATLAGEPTTVDIRIRVLTFAPERVLGLIEDTFRQTDALDGKSIISYGITQISPKVG